MKKILITILFLLVTFTSKTFAFTVETQANATHSGFYDLKIDNCISGAGYYIYDPVNNIYDAGNSSTCGSYSYWLDELDSTMGNTWSIIELNPDPNTTDVPWNTWAGAHAQPNFVSNVTFDLVGITPTPTSSGSPSGAFSFNNNMIQGIQNLGVSMGTVGIFSMLTGLGLVGGFVVSKKGFGIVLKWILNFIH